MKTNIQDVNCFVSNIKQISMNYLEELGLRPPYSALITLSAAICKESLDTYSKSVDEPSSQVNIILPPNPLRLGFKENFDMLSELTITVDAKSLSK